MEDGYNVNGSSLPLLLIELLRNGQWQHPGDDALRMLIPFSMEPVDFLGISSIHRETSGLLRHADDPKTAELFYLSRGSRASLPVELPWLDAERAVLIAVNRDSGDDVAIALDFRGNTEDPRVVASHWNDAQSPWAEISPSFSAFVRRLRLQSA